MITANHNSGPAARAPINTLIVDDERLARELLRSLAERDPRLEVVAECNDGMAALGMLEQHPIELVFLDVQMPLMDGLEVARALSKKPQPPYIIFVTAFGHYAIDAFELNALDYLVKPIEKERFNHAVTRAATAIRQQSLCDLTERLLSLAEHQRDSEPAPVPEDLIVWKGSEPVKVRLDDIIWVEAANQYVQIHLERDSFVVAESLGRFLKRLDQPRFQRVHRSAVVNTEHLAHIRKNANGTHDLLLRGEVRLTLSRSRRALVPALLRAQRSGTA